MLPLLAFAEDEGTKVVPQSVPQVEKSNYWPMRFHLGTRDAAQGDLEHATGDVVLIHDGRAVMRSKIGPGGVAMVPKTGSGQYSIVVRGNQGYAAFAYYLDSTWVFQDEFKVDVTLAPAVNFPLIEETIYTAAGQSRNLPQEKTHLGPVKQVADLEEYGSQIVNDVLPIDDLGCAKLELMGYADMPNEFLLLPERRVVLVKQGRVLAHQISDENGLVTFNGIDPGRYTLIVNGWGEFFVTSVLAKKGLGKGQAILLLPGGPQTGQFVAANSSVIGVAPIPARDMPAVASVTESGPGGGTTPNGLGGGAGGFVSGPGAGTGSGSGGTGGGGLGGGLATLGALGGLGAAAALLTNEDDRPVTSIAP